MKVICLADYFESENIKDYKIKEKPIKGNVYTVAECVKRGSNFFYIFNEIPEYDGNIRNLWESKWFAPLDSFKQDELNEELSEIFKKEKA